MGIKIGQTIVKLNYKTNYLPLLVNYIKGVLKRYWLIYIIVMLIIDKKALVWYIHDILASSDGVETSNR